MTDPKDYRAVSLHSGDTRMTIFLNVTVAFPFDNTEQKKRTELHTFKK